MPRSQLDGLKSREKTRGGAAYTHGETWPAEQILHMHRVAEVVARTACRVCGHLCLHAEVVDGIQRHRAKEVVIDSWRSTPASSASRVPVGGGQFVAPRMFFRLTATTVVKAETHVRVVRGKVATQCHHRATHVNGRHWISTPSKREDRVLRETRAAAMSILDVDVEVAPVGQRWGKRLQKRQRARGGIGAILTGG